MLIVDDVISTGESLRAMEELVTRAGGIIAGRMAVLAEGDAQARHDIICLARPAAPPAVQSRRHRQGVS